LRYRNRDEHRQRLREISVHGHRFRHRGGDT